MIASLTRLALICLCAAPVWLILRKPWRGFLPREIVLGAFAIFMAGMLCMALEGKWASPDAMLRDCLDRIRTGRDIFLRPFRLIAPQLRTLDEDALTQLLGNTLLFAPWGFCLPLLWRRFRIPLRMIGLSLALPLFIECTQLFIGRVVEVDDVLLNFAGALCGAGLWWCVHKLVPATDLLSEDCCSR